MNDNSPARRRQAAQIGETGLQVGEMKRHAADDAVKCFSAKGRGIGVGDDPSYICLARIELTPLGECDHRRRKVKPNRKLGTSGSRESENPVTAPNIEHSPIVKWHRGREFLVIRAAVAPLGIPEIIRRIGFDFSNLWKDYVQLVPAVSCY